MKFKYLLITGFTLILFSACSGEKQKESLIESAMKCGPGKCGASMVDGSAVLVKKKTNILNQLTEDDTRRECVFKSMTTKELYACVRDKDTGRLSIKHTTENTKKISD